MKKRFLALLLVGCLLIVLGACQTEQDELYSQAVEDQKSAASVQPTVDPNDPDYLGDPTPLPGTAYTPVPNDDLQGELVIKSYVQTTSYSDRLDLLIEEFTRLHPGVEIHVDYHLSASQSLSSKEEWRMAKEQFRGNTQAELASGEADYLLYGVSDILDMSSLSRNGILFDMASYWEKDPDIQEEEIYMPVLEACKIDGKMTAIPMSFSFPAVMFSQRLMEEVGIDLTGVKAVSSTQLLDWYDQARESKPDLNLFFTSPGKDALFSTEKVDYIDVSSATSSFQPSEFVDFLERTNGVGNNEPDLSEDLIGYGYGSPGLARYWEEYRETGKVPLEVSMSLDAGFPQLDLVTRKAKEWFAVASAESLYTFYTVQDPLPYLTQPYPLISSDGKLGISSYEDFAMPESLQNKDLAWEFIKYCLSVREDPTFYELTGFRWPYVSQGFPLNKENYRKMVEYIAAGNAYGTSLIGYPGNYKGIDPEALLAELDEILTCDPVNVNAYNVNVQEYLDEFYVNGLITAEECADKIQGRAEIWLNE